MAGTRLAPYKRQASEDIDKRAREGMTVTLVPDEERAVLILMRGPCPVCTHDTRFAYPLVGVEGAADVSSEQLLEVADSLGSSQGNVDARGRCLCGHGHKGHPPDENGCGARWGINVSWGEP